MAVPEINFHRLARSAADMANIAKGVSRRLTTNAPAGAVDLRQAPPLPQGANGPLFQVTGARGVVVGLQIINKAFTQTGGGGGYMHRGTGSIAPVWSQTTHVRRTEFWLRDHQGQERNYWLEGHDEVVLRDGQDVTLLFLNGALAFIRNHTAGQIHPLINLNQLIPLPPMATDRATRILVGLAVGGGIDAVICFALAVVVHDFMRFPISLPLLAIMAMLGALPALPAALALDRHNLRLDQERVRVGTAYRDRVLTELNTIHRRYLT